MASVGPARHTSYEDDRGAQASSESPERALTDDRVAAGSFAVCEPTWRRVVARLVYDSHHHRPIAGARSGLIDQRRLLFETGDVAIDLEVGRSGIAGRLRMLGQVTTDQPPLVPAWVIAEGASGHFEAEVDDFGQFSLDGLASGLHRLELGLNLELIEIPAIQL